MNIVTFDNGERYHVDVAFGGDGTTMPMPLIDGLVHQNLGTQEIRLVRDWVPTQVHRTEESKLWIYQYRNGSDKAWNSFYSFPGVEFMSLDWGVVNFWMALNSASNQRNNVLAIKFLRRPRQLGDDQDLQEIYGKRMLLNGLVKENLGGKTRVVAELKTENDRLQAIDRLFGIRLTEDERQGIRNYLTELKE